MSSTRGQFNDAVERGVPIHFLPPTDHLDPREAFPCGSRAHEPASEDWRETTCAGCREALRRLTIRDGAEVAVSREAHTVEIVKEGAYWRPVCSCGEWEGCNRRNKGQAAADGAEHIRHVAAATGAPAGEAETDLRELLGAAERDIEAANRVYGGQSTIATRALLPVVRALAERAGGSGRR